MGEAQAALSRMEEMEETAQTDATADRPEAGLGERPAQCLQWQSAMVECRCLDYERGSSACFRKLGLISLLEEVQWFTVLREQRSL